MNDKRKLANRYELGDLIGRGGMAEVFEAVDTRLNRTVAIKILRDDLARDPAFIARFRREAQAAAALNHPTIVAVYDTGEEIEGEGRSATNVPYIVMEYVNGTTLRDIVKSGRKLQTERALKILIATVLFSLVSTASNTSAMPPRPIRSPNSYLLASFLLSFNSISPQV